MNVVFVVVGGVAVALPDDYQSSPEHRRFLTDIQRPGLKYAEAVALLEAAASDSRRDVAADLMPQADWARQFVCVTALNLAREDKKLAERGLRAITSLLLGQRKRIGRPRAITNQMVIRQHVAHWKGIVQAHWPLVRDGDRAQFCSHLKHRIVPTLLRKPRVRPMDVVYGIVADDLGVTPRRIRAALQDVDLTGR